MDPFQIVFKWGIYLKPNWGGGKKKKKIFKWAGGGARFWGFLFKFFGVLF